MFARFGSLRDYKFRCEKTTFQDTAAALFNNLPDSVKKWNNFKIFSSRILRFLKNRAQAPLL